MPILEVQRLSKSYRQMGGETTVAVGNISCRVEAGEFVSFVGPSGCGKTTLLMSIAGLIAPTTGKILVKGREVSGPPPDLVLVFQEFNKSLFAWRSVLGNVLFGLGARGKRLRESEAKAKALIELVGLKGFERHYPWELSGGMQQRTSICRALIHEPEMLLLDEPFGALDAFTREELWCALRDLQAARKVTVMLVTHDLREAVFLADTVYVMSSRPGRIVKRREVKIPRPRELEVTYTQEFQDIVHELRALIGKH
jgi:NitT/TauT family transport system ATP-binding protein